MRDVMLKNAQSSEGRDILRDRPRLNTQTIDVPKLAAMPEGSFGRAYVDWLESCKVTPDTRDPVRRITSRIHSVGADVLTVTGPLHRRP